MKFVCFVMGGLCLLGVFGFRDAVDTKRVQEAQARLHSLPRMAPGLWKTLIQQHGWIYGAPSAKIKMLGFVTPKAKLELQNVLFGSPTHQGDTICKTMMMPDDGSKTWTVASKLRIAYALMEPMRYKAPAIVLDAQKQIGEPNNGDFEREFKLVPADIQQKAEAELESYKVIAKQIKVDTYYLQLPNGDAVEVGHPFNVEKVWNEYLLTKGN